MVDFYGFHVGKYTVRPMESVMGFLELSSTNPYLKEVPLLGGTTALFPWMVLVAYEIFSPGTWLGKKKHRKEKGGETYHLDTPRKTNLSPKKGLFMTISIGNTSPNH